RTPQRKTSRPRARSPSASVSLTPSRHCGTTVTSGSFPRCPDCLRSRRADAKAVDFKVRGDTTRDLTASLLLYELKIMLGLVLFWLRIGIPFLTLNKPAASVLILAILLFMDGIPYLCLRRGNESAAAWVFTVAGAAVSTFMVLVSRLYLAGACFQ